MSYVSCVILSYTELSLKIVKFYFSQDVIHGYFHKLSYQLVATLLHRARKAVSLIQEELRTERHTGTVEYKLLDLASLESVRNCAKELIGSEGRIDILILNAGKESLRFEFVFWRVTYLKLNIVLYDKNVLNNEVK